jgi:O-antigen/teichoic acid export membrane protein
MVTDEDLSLVKNRAVRGMVTLTGGGVILTAIFGLGVLVLQSYLSPAEFGIYFLMLSVTGVLNYFSDIGLAASLIQKKDSPTTLELRTTFTIQQSLVLLLVAITIILSPFIKSYYSLGTSEYWLLMALLVSFVLSSLKSIPSVMLERELGFDKIMIVRIVEGLIFNIVAVIMAAKGFGIVSYIPAVLGQGFAGLILLYFFKPWPIGLAFSHDSLKKLLKFGVPYQTNSLLAVAKDQFMNLFLWKIIGASGMGYLSWGIYYSQQPQRLIMDNATKVAFPALSRIQDNPKEFARSTERLIMFVCLVIFPMVVGIGLAWSHLAYLVPKWFKWQPALVPLYIACFGAVMSCLSTSFSGILYALGKAKLNTGLMIMWLGLEWLIKPILAIRFGYMGVAYAMGIISLFSLIPLLIARKIIGFNLIKSLLTAFASAGLMLTIGVLVHSFGIVVTLLMSTVGYFVGVLAFGGKNLWLDIKPFYDHFRQKL